MLDSRFIREHPDEVRKGLLRRGLDAGAVDALLECDKRYREVLGEVETFRRQAKEFSRSGGTDSGTREEARKVRERLKGLEAEERKLREELDGLLDALPNLPLPEVPDGRDKSDNVVGREGRKPAKKSFVSQDHLALGEAHGLVDVERAARVAGTRFAYLKREGAMLEFALIRYAFDILSSEGFIPVVPPAMVRPEVFRGMGRLAADQREERYHLERDNLYLIGSAEHTLGPMHMDEVLEAAVLPLRYVGFSPSFRREAGSYGKDTRGIIRVHQFDKAEMFVFASPEASGDELERLVALQERIVAGLELPYRVVAISAGDMGWTDAKQYDIEVWFPSEERFRETHSASNTTDFQARGVNVRFRRDAGAKPEYLHMLNATAVAIGRTIAALLENHQQEDGTIQIPEALRSYCGFDRIPNPDSKF